MQEEKTLWPIEPHTGAKHDLLNRYIGAWFGILGPTNNKLVYVDGFSGPGKYQGGELGSPIIVLKTAISQYEKGNLQFVDFYFIEINKSRYEYLKAEVESINKPSCFTVNIINGEFEKEMVRIMDKYSQKIENYPPMFVFVDPFGFKGCPFSVIKDIMSHPKSEVFINVMAEFINRFLEHPDEAVTSHIENFFGTERVFNICNLKTNRMKEIRDLFLRQLLNCSGYVNFFEMQDENHRLIYYLFFATNHPLGISKMKEAMWKIDNQAGLSFSDAIDPDQLVLLSLDPSLDLKEIVFMKFRGKTVTKEDIQAFVEKETHYIPKHLTKALQLLEKEKRISVDPQKINGDKRFGKTFACGTIIKFV